MFCGKKSKILAFLLMFSLCCNLTMISNAQSELNAKSIQYYSVILGVPEEEVTKLYNESFDEFNNTVESMLQEDNSHTKEKKNKKKKPVIMILISLILVAILVVILLLVLPLVLSSELPLILLLLPLLLLLLFLELVLMIVNLQLF